MGGNDIEEPISKYVECASCKHIFSCKVRNEKADDCLNYENGRPKDVRCKVDKD